MSKQTAVEWLVEELTKQNMYMHLFAKEIQKAKAMEKEQMKHGFDEGSMYDYEEGFEEYYEEFYGK